MSAKSRDRVTQSLGYVLGNIAGSPVQRADRLNIHPAEALPVGRPIVDRFTPNQLLADILGEPLPKAERGEVGKRKPHNEAVEMPSTALMLLRDKQILDRSPMLLVVVPYPLGEETLERCEVMSVKKYRADGHGNEEVPGITKPIFTDTAVSSGDIAGELLHIDAIFTNCRTVRQDPFVTKTGALNELV